MDRAEAAGLGVAAVGHVALFAALSLGFATMGDPPAPSDAIEVSFADDVGLTSQAPQPVPAAPAPGAAPEAGPIEDAPALPAPREAAPLPSPVPSPAPSRRPAEAPRADAPARRAATPARPNAAASGQRTRRPLNADDLLKGIGRDPTDTPAARPAAAMTGEARASINAAIRRALVPCERQPLPAPEAAAINVTVRVALEPDGSLASAEVTRVQNPNPALQQYERRMQDLALAVIRRCTPIRGLPAELYDVPRGWRQFNYVFDPR